MSKTIPVMSRRDFVKAGAATVAGLAIAPSDISSAESGFVEEYATNLQDSNEHPLSDFNGNDSKINHDKFEMHSSKVYEPTNYSGMGRVVVDKNMVDGVNTLTQAMINTANTIYVIKYDFILAGNIVIPSNCVLDFEGGSISGTFTLTGDNTSIRACLVKIFNASITLSGGWNVSEGYPEWYGAKGDGIMDDSEAINKTIQAFVKTRLSAKTYYIGNYVEITDNKTLEGSDWEGTIIRKSKTFNTDNCLLRVIGAHINIRHIRLESTAFNTTYGILFGNCNHVNVENMSIFKCQYCLYTSNTSMWLVHFNNIICNCNSRYYFGDKDYGFTTCCGVELVCADGGGSNLQIDNLWARDAERGFHIKHFSSLIMNNVTADNLFYEGILLEGIANTCVNCFKIENSVLCCPINLQRVKGVFNAVSLQSYLKRNAPGNKYCMFAEKPNTRVTFINCDFGSWIIKGEPGTVYGTQTRDGAKVFFYNCIMFGNVENTFVRMTNNACEIYYDENGMYKRVGNNDFKRMLFPA